VPDVSDHAALLFLRLPGQLGHFWYPVDVTLAIGHGQHHATRKMPSFLRMGNPSPHGPGKVPKTEPQDITIIGAGPESPSENASDFARQPVNKRLVKHVDGKREGLTVALSAKGAFVADQAGKLLA